MSPEKQETIQLSGIFEELRKILPDTADFIEVLFSTLKDFENVDVYKTNPERIADCDGAIDEVAYEVTERMKSELSDKASKDSNSLQIVKDLFSELHDLLSSGPNVYKYFMREIFEHLGVSTMDLDEKHRPHVYSKYIVPNILLDKTEIGRLFTTLGLVNNPTAGKGSHEKWTDPTGEMKSFAIIAQSDKMWLKNEIKKLIAKGISIERIRIACEKCNIRFEEK